MWYFIFLVCWIVLLSALRIAWEKWRKWNYCQPARYVSEIRGLRYFQTLSAAQFNQLVMEGLKQREFTLLGNPMLGASREQGFAWKSGKRAVVAAWLERAPTPQDLDQLAILQSRVKAERVMVFAPFPKAPLPIQSSIQMIAGNKLLDWFSILSAMKPPVSGKLGRPNCECGAPMDERVNRAGGALLVCSRYPDCKHMRQPENQAAAAQASS